MHHEDRPRTISEAIDAATFPVFGVTGHPLDLFLSSWGTGISHLGNFMHVSFQFTSPRYGKPGLIDRDSAKNKNFRIFSIDATTQDSEREHMVFDLKDPLQGQFFNDRGTFGQHHFTEEEQKQAGNPLILKESFSIDNTFFLVKYYIGIILFFVHLCS